MLDFQRSSSQSSVGEASPIRTIVGGKGTLRAEASRAPPPTHPPTPGSTAGSSGRPATGVTAQDANRTVHTSGWLTICWAHRCGSQHGFLMPCGKATPTTQFLECVCDKQTKDHSHRWVFIPLLNKILLFQKNQLFLPNHVLLSEV